MVSVKDIERAAKRLKNVVHTIPLSGSHTFSKMSGAKIYLKYENQQKTGSFKVRGAYNKIMKLHEESPLNAVVASSAGNHAQGVAYAAKKIGIPATIVMPRSTPIAKVSATQGYGAKVVLHGTCYDDAYAKACEICEKENATFIHPFDDDDVIAGQGTIAMEILSDLPSLDMIVVPAGGGGLVSGIAAYVKQINPRIQVVGVQADGASAIQQSFKAKKAISTDIAKTIADGIAVKCPGTVTMSHINQYVDQIVTVSDAEIASTLLLLIERTKQVVEPAGAASLAAVLNNKIEIQDKKVACILSGGNIDVSFIHKVVERGLVNRGRQMKFSTILPDSPGSLEGFATLLAEENANITRFQHDRSQADLEFGQAIIDLVVEVGGEEHGNQLLNRLSKEGYTIIKEDVHSIKNSSKSK